jgi:electron transfer flavoprotein beta subunit
MNILVLLKQTFDTEESIVIEKGQIREDGVKFIINPYDEYAVEEAIQLKEKHGGTISVISMGPSRVEGALRAALAMGADQAVLINGDKLSEDEYVISKVLASYIKGQAYDIILSGYMAVDDGSAQVGPRIAEELKIPHVATIVKLDIKDSTAIVESDVEGNKEVLEIPLPVFVTAQQGLNEPRFPSLPNLVKAKKKPLLRISTEDLDLSADLNDRTECITRFLPVKREAGRVLQGTMGDQIKELVQLLQSQVKVG